VIDKLIVFLVSTTMVPALQPASPNLPQSRLIPVDQLPKRRRAYGSKGAAYDTRGRVVTPAGVFSHVIDVDETSGSVGHQTLLEEGDSIEGVEMGEVAVTYVEAMSEPEISHPVLETDANLKRTSKKQRQWRKWSEDIIPALLKPYMSLMQETESLRNIGLVRGRKGCSECMDGRLLDVSCIYFNSEFSVI